MNDMSEKSTEYLKGAMAGLYKGATRENDVEHDRHSDLCDRCKGHDISIELATRLMTDTVKTLNETADALEERSGENIQMRKLLEGVVSIVKKHREYTLANQPPSPHGQPPSHVYLDTGENTALMSVQHGAIHLLVDMADEEPEWLNGGVCPCGDRGC